MKAFILLALLALAAAEYPTRGTPAFNNDNNVLQYALTLEHLEAAFYAEGLTAFPADIFPPEIAYVRDLMMMIKDHEDAHVAALSQILRDRGVTPVGACNYTFDFSNVLEFLALAQVLETTGVSAYDATFTYLTQTDLINLAAGVAAVEARHASAIGRVIEVMNGPFPNVTDIPLTPMQIVPIAAGFIDGACAQLAPVIAATYAPAASFRNVSAYNQTVYNQTAAYINDNNVLQYALTLEHLEAAFYQNAINQLDEAYYINMTSEYDAALLAIILEQEKTHVLYLQSLLTNRGATPVSPCNYVPFPIANTEEGLLNFFETAFALETVGTGAYVGAHQFFTDAALLATASTVSTVEARHTAYLGYVLSAITGNFTAPYSPFPDAVNAGLTPSQVLTAASQFITPPASDCVTFTLPVSADNFRPNSTVSTSSSSSSSSSSSGSISSTTGSTTTRTSATASEPSSANVVAIYMAVVAILALLF